MANNTISQVEINGTTYDLLDANTLSALDSLKTRVTTLESSVGSFSFSDSSWRHISVSIPANERVWVANVSKAAIVAVEHSYVIAYLSATNTTFQIYARNFEASNVTATVHYKLIE